MASMACCTRFVSPSSLLQFPQATIRKTTCSTPVIDTPFTIKVPINVFQSNFKRGRMLIKNAGSYAPWGATDVAELYMVLDNQPGLLSLLPCGTAVSAWEDGQFLEVQGNREVVGGDPFRTSWSFADLIVASGPFQGTYDRFTGTGSYTSYCLLVLLALAPLLELLLVLWKVLLTSSHGTQTLLTLRLVLVSTFPFRDQANRLLYSTEQAGGFVLQQDGENIIDAVMRGAFLTKATVPYAEVGVWMNPVTRIQMGYEEGDNVRVLRDNFVQGAVVWQRGTKTTDYQDR